MVTRLVGGLTPGDGADPRTFPAIWNVTADDIEALQSDLGGVQSGLTTLGGSVAVQATIIDANSTAIAGIEAWELENLNDVSYGTALADGQTLVYSTAVSGWTNGSATGGGGSGNVADDVIQPNFNLISNSYTFPDNFNGVSAGPVTIASGATVTVGTASAWSIV